MQSTAYKSQPAPPHKLPPRLSKSMAGLGTAGLLEGKSSLPDRAVGLPRDTESPRYPGLKLKGSQY